MSWNYDLDGYIPQERDWILTSHKVGRVEYVGDWIPHVKRWLRQGEVLGWWRPPPPPPAEPHVKKARLHVCVQIGMQSWRLGLFDTMEQAFAWADEHRSKYTFEGVDPEYPEFSVSAEWVPIPLKGTTL